MAATPLARSALPLPWRANDRTPVRRLTPLRLQLGILLGTVTALAVTVPMLLHAFVLMAYLEEQAGHESTEMARVVGALTERRVEQSFKELHMLSVSPGFLAEVAARDTARMTVRLERAVGVDDDHGTLLVRDRDGIAWATASADKSILGQPIVPSSGLDRIVETRAPTLGRAMVGPVTRMPVVPLSLPIWDDNGEIVGYVGASLRLDRLAQHLVTLRTSAQGVVSLYDQEGKVLVSPYEAAGGVVAHEPDSAVMRAMRGEIARIQTTGPDGSPVFAVAAPTSYGWVVEVHEPVSAVHAPLYALLVQDGLIALGAFVLAVLVGVVAGRRITEPLLALLPALRSIRHDEGGPPLPRSSTTEVALLTDELEAVRATLDARTAESRQALSTLARYQLLAKHTTDIVLFIGRDRAIVEANEAAERAYGYDRADLIGRPVFDLLADPQTRLSAGEIDRAFAEGIAFEATHRRRDGTTFPIEVSMIGVRGAGDDSEPLLVTIGRDVSARRAVEDALRMSEAQYRSVVESIKEVVFQLDADGRFTLLNPAWTALTEFDVADTLGRPFLGFVHPEDRPLILRALATSDDRPTGPRRCEIRVLMRSGATRWLDTYLTPTLDVDGLVQRISGTLMDVTERRLAETARTRMLVREQMVRAREDRAAEVSGIVQHMPCGVLVFDNESCVTLANERALEMLSPTLSDADRPIAGGVVLHPTELLDHRKLAPCRSLVARALGGSVVSEAELRHVVVRSDSPVLVGSAAPLRAADGSVRGAVVILTDVTRERRLMHDLMVSEGSLRHSLESMVVMHEAARALSSTLVEDEIGRRLVQSCSRIARLDAALVFMVDSTGGARLLGEDGDPLLISHVLTCAEVQAERAESLDHAAIAEISPIRPCAETSMVRGFHLPLVARGRTIGVLEIYGAEQFSTVTKDALASLAAHAISALENAHLYREVGDREQRLQDALRRLLIAQEEERRRVAYELHDGLAQVAAATHLSLQTFASQYRPRSERTRQQLDRSVDLARRVVREARQVIAGLRPTVLDDFGLERALRLHVQELVTEGWDVDLQADLGRERLPGPIETVLYRIAQEALTNVRKHARSRTALVRLQQDEDAVELTVVDQGVGFEPSEASPDSDPGQQVGLVGMRERAALVGGECVVWSEPGRGTRVTVRIPMAVVTSQEVVAAGALHHGR